jgi:magnesium-protoporphyrin O-methyltransferase
MLVESLRRACQASVLTPKTLLDIGAGIGIVHHEMLGRDVERAVHVEISPTYLEAAREETERLGHASRVHFVQGDFLAVAEAAGVADLVTLDRVICCYPDMPALVRRSAASTRQLYGAVYPRDKWWVRIGTALENAFRRVKGSAFRTYVHPPVAIRAELERAGLELIDSCRTFVWEIGVYGRKSG